ncbi:hypothetical protein N9T82_00800 [Candidatus Pelagibacter sp.]|jgi:hypothetical protein|nr:hypothetical protein [Candidatus Pelagibacter sp.]|tara:strand:- start:94 stop:387 length:294 start_codon:yes stop_codon:yes gene_type:complete
MLNFKFDKKLVSTKELLGQLGFSLAWLDNKKTRWRKRGLDCWDMGLRLIGTKAFWDPVEFTKWLYENECKNKPTNTMERTENTALISFIKRNVSYDD